MLNKFDIGSTETLKIPNIRDELLKFYKNNYSSNLMSLVLVSNLSLDELQNQAVQHFSKVENRNLPARDFSKEVVYDEAHTFGRICKIIPDKVLRQIALKWINPPTTALNTKKSSYYISKVMGNEGPNSLLSQLIKENLATGLGAASEAKMNQAFDLF